MKEFTKVPVEVVNEVMEEFYKNLSEQDYYVFSQNKEKNFLKNTVGSDRASQLGLGDSFSNSSSEKFQFESLELVDINTLVNYLKNEHPQTIALIVAHLDALRKSQVMEELPESLQSDVVLRITKLDRVDVDELKKNGSDFEKELCSLRSYDGF